jgi:phage-related minor tail protein
MNWLLENYQIIIALILGFYEVLARVIPTVGNWSILGFIIKLLKWLSDALDNKRSK